MAFSFSPSNATPTSVTIEVDSLAGDTSGTLTLNALLGMLNAGPLYTLITRNVDLAALVDSGRLQLKVLAPDGSGSDANLGPLLSVALQGDGTNAVIIGKGATAVSQFNMRLSVGNSLTR